MAIRKTPPILAPAFNELTFIDDTATEMTVQGYPPAQSNTVILTRVKQVMANPDSPTLPMLATRFNASGVVRNLFKDRQESIRWWARHDYNLKALYYTSIDGTLRTGINAVRQIGESLDMYETGESAVLTHHKKDVNGRRTMPTYSGFPVGVTVMAKKWYEIDLSKAFIFNVHASSGVPVTMNFRDTSSIVVLWGDGSIEQYSDRSVYQISHTYATTDIFECSILVDDTGEYWGATQISGVAAQNMQAYMGNIIQWGYMQVCRLQYSTNIQTIPSTPYPGRLTNVASMFEGVSYLASDIPVNFFENVAEGITDLSSLFSQCGNQTIARNTYRSISGETFKYFPMATNLTMLLFECGKNLPPGQSLQIPRDLFRYLTNATTLIAALAYVGATSIPSDLLYGMVNAVNIASLFTGFLGPQVPGNLFVDCSKVTNASNLFLQGTYTSINVNALNGLSNVQVLNAAFAENPYLVSIPARLFDPVPNVQTITGIFSSCGVVSTPINIPNTLFRAMTKLTGVADMFRYSYINTMADDLLSYATSLRVLDRAFFGMRGSIAYTIISGGTIGAHPGATSAASMFEEATAGITNDAFTGLSSISSMYRFMYNANVEVMPGAFSSWVAIRTMSYAFYGSSYLPLANEFDAMVNLENIDYCFANNTGDVLYQVFGVTPKPNIINILRPFQNMTSLTTVVGDPFAPFINVKSCLYAFSSCTRLKTIDESLFSGLVNCEQFQNALQYTMIDIPTKLFNNNKVANNFNNAFLGTAGFKMSGSTPITDEGYRLWEREGKLGYPNLVQGENCFSQQTQLTDFNDIPFPWKR